jgi:hypothetical protein
MLCCTARPIRAADAEPSSGDAERSVTAGREAFEGGGSFPWYDAPNDDLRPITLRRAREPWRFPSFSLQWVVWGLLALLLGGLLIVLARKALDQRGRSRRLDRREPDRISDPLRVEALPFMAERPREDLLGEARRHYQAGNYSEAMIYLFSYELVQLDKSALIQLAKGKTNRQYLREAGQVRQLRILLELTIVTFEDVFFGRRPLDRSGFEACWDRLDEFENLVARAAP